jgi:hypothetical protein
VFHVEPAFADLLRAAGIADAQSAFTHPSIRVWRSIRERENATLDLAFPNRQPVRIHIKRDKSAQRKSPSHAEAQKLLALRARGVPTAALIAHGRVEDGRSFVMTEDLAGFAPADRLLRDGRVTFDQLLSPTAELAARLHASGAFHRDLYLCHFFARADADPVDLRLIDCARALIDPFLRRRWQVKDLGQFLYSTREFAISPAQLDAWFDTYARRHPLPRNARAAIAAKADRIARHDASLRRRNPERTASIPD